MLFCPKVIANNNLLVVHRAQVYKQIPQQVETFPSISGLGDALRVCVGSELCGALH